jgi:hypothetical protein
MKICCATGRKGVKKAEYEKVGLIHNHAYSFIGVYSIDKSLVR